jgi:hypothetical protein
VYEREGERKRERKGGERDTQREKEAAVYSKFLHPSV